MRAILNLSVAFGLLSLGTLAGVSAGINTPDAHKHYALQKMFYHRQQLPPAIDIRGPDVENFVFASNLGIDPIITGPRQ